MLKSFIGQIKQSLAASLGLEPDSVNVKATTTDGLGFVGRGDGIASIAVATVEKVE